MIKFGELAYPGLSLNPATSNDSEVLYTIFKSTGPDLLPATQVQETDPLESLSRLQFDARQRHYQESYPNSAFYLVKFERFPIGNFFLATMPDEIRLLDISLLSDWRNRGIGTALLNALIMVASRQRSRLSLHVQLGNPATGLYRRLGFDELESDGIYLHMMRLPDSRLWD